MSDISDIEIHNIRIGYLQTLSSFGVEFKEALEITDSYIKNPLGVNSVGLDNPDLSIIKEQIDAVRKTVDDKDPKHYYQTDLGEIATKSLEAYTPDEERLKNIADELKSSDEILIKRPEKTPTQQITPDFGKMVDPKQTKVEEKISDQGELEVSEELKNQRTAGGKIPMRYEDRVKMAEQYQPQNQQSIDRPENAKIDGRGYGESGGDLPPGTK